MCVFDAGFNMNNVSSKFSCKSPYDFFGYLTGQCDVSLVLNQDSYNLFFVKTNLADFNYFKFEKLTTDFIEKIKQKFDYILIDLSIATILKSKVFFDKKYELFFIFSDNEIDVFNSLKFIKNYLSNFQSINQKIILIEADIFEQKKGINFSIKKIEKIFKMEIVSILPKTIKNNNYDLNKLTKIQKQFLNQLKNSFLNNAFEFFDYNKYYSGVSGFFRKIIYLIFK